MNIVNETGDCGNNFDTRPSPEGVTGLDGQGQAPGARFLKERNLLGRKSDRRAAIAIRISLETARTVCRADGARSADLPCNVRRERYCKRNRYLWQERTVDIPIRDPNKLAALVIESPKNVGDIHDLAALINQLPRKGGPWRRIQSLIPDLDDGICRGRDQGC